MWAFALVRTTLIAGPYGRLAPDPVILMGSYFGFSKVGQLSNWGAFLISGSGVQLQALNALDDVVGICVMTKSGEVRWAELDNVINPTLRDKLNLWLAARGYGQIPADWTNRQVVVAVLQHFRANFDLTTDNTWVVDAL